MHLSLCRKKHGLKYICDLFEIKHTEFQNMVLNGNKCANYLYNMNYKELHVSTVLLMNIFVLFCSCYFRNGVVDAKYLPLKIAFDFETKRIHPEPDKNAKWITVCGVEDKQCQECHKS